MSSSAGQTERRKQRKRRPARRAEVERMLARVGTLERIAGHFEANDASRAELLQVSRDVLEDIGPVTVTVAAALLGVSEPTVRLWVRRGLLHPAKGENSGLDALRLHEVVALVRELRAVGHNRDLLNRIWHRLSDASLLDRADVQRSLDQMRLGEGLPTNPHELEEELRIADQPHGYRDRPDRPR